MKDLFLLRGVPGAGKSSMASILSPAFNIAADDYFDEVHGGKFVPSELKDAHAWCQDMVEEWMSFDKPVIAVANTFTRAWEMEYYRTLAKEYGYRVHSIIVENRHGSESLHQVPPETVAKMADRFEIKLN